MDRLQETVATIKIAEVINARTTSLDQPAGAVHVDLISGRVKMQPTNYV